MSREEALRASLRTRCRQGIQGRSSRKRIWPGRMPKNLACGGRHTAFDKFCIALSVQTTRGQFYGACWSTVKARFRKGFEPWRHLEAQDHWARPRDATDENIHLMVQCMESWLLADRSGLETYFGPDFNRNALPGSREVEEVAKTDVLRGLRNATRRSKRGEYDKGNHSYVVLGLIDSAKVLDASPYAKRLVETLRDKASR